ncbi:lytic murein transglycosylase B [Caldimonas tepidiphila]|uniref:lytic murein transglycosylase B n=1 Tax=Caldimonas tepidiphila TaxID=2315841 RepID=UPI000E5C1BB4|nr:lytic murein transglycosylase B [Caldimonas tepidiphila]
MPAFLTPALRRSLSGLIALPLLSALALPAEAAGDRPASRSAMQSKAAAAQKSRAKKPHRAKAAALAAAAAAPLAVRADEAPDTVTYGGREDVMQFAQQVAERHKLDAEWVRSVLAQSRYLPSVARLIMPPPAGTPKNWTAYRARFVEPRRIRAGTEFWRSHARWLRQAEEAYGVPAEIVVGIIGVETLYGQHTGSFRVVDALATLSFDFPAGRRDRSNFFRGELEQLFVLAQAERLDVNALRGSYAGALGLPQFMPSSWTRYAVDFDGDGRADLQGSAADAIGSVANYLAQFGWQTGMPTHFAVAPPQDPADRAVLLGPDILPSFTAAEFAARGAALDAQGQRFGAHLALVELQNGAASPSYIAGTPNFYAITRYNWSSYYAAAVIELGREVRAALAQPG